MEKEEGKKRCSGCKEMLNLSMFNKDSYKADGLKCYCKMCQRIRSAEEYQRKKERRERRGY